MAEFTHDDVAAILRLIEQSSLDSFEFSDGRISFSVMSKGALESLRAHGLAAPAAGSIATAPAAPVQSERAASVPVGGVASDGAGAGSGAVGPAPVPSEPASPGGSEGSSGRPVVAPSVGIFYVAPEPGARPFVLPGDTVTPDTVVGLIEAMKVFTTVHAGLSGTVTTIVAENEALVETGDPLILLS
jgi:acetyl-CoA carboxylase biotin carboxyl carrier protein